MSDDDEGVVANISFAIFSCMQLRALLFAWGAGLSSTLAVGPVARAAAARKRLEAGGMDLDLDLGLDLGL